ncbi:AbrB/MazE/SpoVT family DNA-binding domain-containing protein [Candidatus Woesearchaeota archaeon]|nr:MAG: SpoVT/AbrB family transcription regulator [archaeon GW2011_AR4]MBS3130241.1 AbrB/MazE/SpoVT family DNA-binding domain-containing protein [Candidatus Woesearchaeota archaeon]HIH38172.1 AbrB/MazE/SpoVT family DNA-binding domain-containing protein [Candidatus Woesearchaeota archaeon]HIH48141.1 AbrB/MazE/SpoVT family DNA-binding domain-containing protein [Candidatus Woesearchaeota archaeon]HIJ03849.1 AbrB/MazE/SpoVT family DNA-binding domain-containing protein [Candidatus Woesearchaeota arc
MEKLEITSMSSRGQVVIPVDIREQLGLKEGEKFVVVGEDDTVILKKVTMPSFKNFEKLIQRTQQFAKGRGITETDVENAIKRARK